MKPNQKTQNVLLVLVLSQLSVYYSKQGLFDVRGKRCKTPFKTETTYFLLTDILKISKKQLDNFPLLIRNNNRIIQKRLNRKIFSSFKPEDMEKKEQLIQEKVAKIKKMK